MMKKNTQLDKLFNDWQLARNYPGFISDGIIDEDLFDKAKKKILFIGKEPNDKSKSDWDFREWWHEEFKGSFSIRIGEWAYGILNKFPPFSPISRDEKWKALKSIAFMDVKKTGGGGRSDYDEILKYIKDDLYFIRKEIEIIDPEIIVSSIGSEGNKMIFGGGWEDTNYCVYYLRQDNRLVIDYYHPSSQGGASMGYVLLEKVLEVIYS